MKVGDTIEIDCPRFQSNTRGPKIITAKVIELFDALQKDGSTGNLEIDVITSDGKWYRYKPLIDGGTYKVKDTK